MARHYESWEDGIRMQHISVNFYKHQIKAIEKVVEAGYSCNRSELIRKIVDQYLEDYFKLMKVMELLTPEQIKIMGE